MTGYGALTLRDADPTSAPRIDHGFLSDPEHHDGRPGSKASSCRRLGDAGDAEATTNIATVVVADRIAHALVNPTRTEEGP